MSSILADIWLVLQEPLLECWEELLDVISEPTFTYFWGVIAVILLVGTGLTRNRFARLGCVAGFVLLGAILYIGIEHGEVGEVMFNGTLL